MNEYQEAEFHKRRLQLAKDFQEGRISAMEHLELLSILGGEEATAYDEPDEPDDDEIDDMIEAHLADEYSFF
jgi:hypothetical protein